MRKFYLIVSLLFAISLIAIYCTSYDFDNPYDSRNLPRVSEDEVVYYCPTVCATQTGASVPDGCFTSQAQCQENQGSDNYITYYCPAAGCVGQVGTNTPSGCFTSPTQCQTAPPSDPFNPNITYETLVDERDNKTYRTVQMPDGNVWMAENLNYRDPAWPRNDVTTSVSVGDKGSWCYDYEPDNCDRYGRLYTWDAAMEACPAGWHLPSDTEWAELIAAVAAGDPLSSVAIKLKSAVGWEPHSTTPVGSNDYGFSALPGGYTLLTSFFSLVSTGYWWSASDSTTDETIAWRRSMGHDNSSVVTIGVAKNYGLSVRCVMGDLPAAPTGVTARANSASSITVSWDAVSGATGYYVYRSSSEAETFTQVATTFLATTFTNTGLTASTTYYYRVAAHSSGAKGEQSNTTFATTLTLPAIPTGVTATANTSGSITISWNTVTDATGYYIYRGSSVTGTFTQVGTTTSETSWTNTGLSANTTYHYRVAAYSDAGTGEQSATVSATTGGPIIGSCTVGRTCTNNVLESNCPATGTFVANETCTHFNPNITYGEFTDERDGQTYRTVEMPDGKTWMAENLNYGSGGGSENSTTWCYAYAPDSCAKYGRLYQWWNAAQVGGGVCPAGWHLPTDAEWDALITAIGENPGTKLKSATGWRSYPNDLTDIDKYGFSALPGGYRSYSNVTRSGAFLNIGDNSYWWTATEVYGSDAYYRVMGYGSEGVGRSSHGKGYGLYVRCVKSD